MDWYCREEILSSAPNNAPCLVVQVNATIPALVSLLIAEHRGHAQSLHLAASTSSKMLPAAGKNGYRIQLGNGLALRTLWKNVMQDPPSCWCLLLHVAWLMEMHGSAAFGVWEFRVVALLSLPWLRAASLDAHATVGVLSHQQATCACVRSVHSSRTIQCSNKPIISRSKFEMEPLGLSCVMVGFWTSGGNSTLHTMGGSFLTNWTRCHQLLLLMHCNIHQNLLVLALGCGRVLVLLWWPATM